MKKATFDGWLGTEDGKGLLVTPGLELPDDHEVVLGHPAMFEDVPEPVEKKPAPRKATAG